MDKFFTKTPSGFVQSDDRKMESGGRMYRREITGMKQPRMEGQPGLFGTVGSPQRRYYLPPVEAMPSMNCRWKIRYRITIGSIASREPAISTGKLVVN